MTKRKKVVLWFIVIFGINMILFGMFGSQENSLSYNPSLLRKLLILAGPVLLLTVILAHIVYCRVLKELRHSEFEDQLTAKQYKARIIESIIKGLATIATVSLLMLQAVYYPADDSYHLVQLFINFNLEAVGIVLFSFYLNDHELAFPWLRQSLEEHTKKPTKNAIQHVLFGLYKVKQVICQKQRKIVYWLLALVGVNIVFGNIGLVDPELIRILYIISGPVLLLSVILFHFVKRRITAAKGSGECAVPWKKMTIEEKEALIKAYILKTLYILTVLGLFLLPAFSVRENSEEERVILWLCFEVEALAVMFLNFYLEDRQNAKAEAEKPKTRKQKESAHSSPEMDPLKDKAYEKQKIKEYIEYIAAKKAEKQKSIENLAKALNAQIMEQSPAIQNMTKPLNNEGNQLDPRGQNTDTVLSRDESNCSNVNEESKKHNLRASGEMYDAVRLEAEKINGSMIDQTVTVAPTEEDIKQHVLDKTKKEAETAEQGASGKAPLMCDEKSFECYDQIEKEAASLPPVGQACYTAEGQRLLLEMAITALPQLAIVDMPGFPGDRLTHANDGEQAYQAMCELIQMIRSIIKDIPKVQLKTIINDLSRQKALRAWKVFDFYEQINEGKEFAVILCMLSNKLL